MSNIPETSSTEIRPEIQGLRAIAALAVVFYHLWPQNVPGGYVGVDIFFVISGFLITSLLLREINNTNQINLSSFYWRRIWRLIPVAFFVIFAVIVLTPILLPPSQWRQVAIESFASAFYFENWLLASQSVDYLAADEAPSPLQHYWSLSVEEQFYIFWPALIITCLYLAKKFRLTFKPTLLITFIVITISSLATSVYVSNANNTGSYFFTHSRIWELGLGAILAIWMPSLGNKLHSLAGFLGIAFIFIAVLQFSAITPFPSYFALLPTVGASLIIVSGSNSDRISIYRILSSRPFQLLGNISYSIYLWHWPIIIFYRASFSIEIGLLEGVALLTATSFISLLSKKYIEDQFRRPEMRWAWWKKFLPLTSLILLPVILWGLIFQQITNQQKIIENTPEQFMGAIALITPPSQVINDGGLAPPPALLRLDKAAIYDNGCHLTIAETEPVACHFGNPQSMFKVLLIGDSHAANWIPALEIIAKNRNWNLESHTKSSCPLSPIMMQLDKQPYEACLSWGKEIMNLIEREKPNLIILAQMKTHAFTNTHSNPATSSLEHALTSLLHHLEATTGSDIVVIADTPAWPNDPDICLFRDKDCAHYPKTIVPDDALTKAALSTSSVALVNLNDFICPKGRCPVIIGNVIVWRDRHHFTATFSRSLAPFLEQELTKALKSNHMINNTAAQPHTKKE